MDLWGGKGHVVTGGISHTPFGGRGEGRGSFAPSGRGRRYPGSALTAGHTSERGRGGALPQSRVSRAFRRPATPTWQRATSKFVFCFKRRPPLP